MEGAPNLTSAEKFKSLVREGVEHPYDDYNQSLMMREVYLEELDRVKTEQPEQLMSDNMYNEEALRAAHEKVNTYRQNEDIDPIDLEMFVVELGKFKKLPETDPDNPYGKVARFGKA